MKLEQLINSGIIATFFLKEQYDFYNLTKRPEWEAFNGVANGALDHNHFAGNYYYRVYRRNGFIHKKLYLMLEEEYEAQQVS
jgi:hypothetical protein